MDRLLLVQFYYKDSMFTFYTKQLDNVIGIMITFRFPYSSSLHDRGYIHSAEHFMFSGTTNLDRDTLRKKHFLIFNKLEAQTSRQAVCLFFYVDRQELAEAVEIIYEMLYSWKCHSLDFEDEKQQLMNEAKEYFSSYPYKMTRNAYSAVGAELVEPLGKASVLRTLKFHELPAIRRRWKKMLTISESDICVIAGALTDKEASLLKRLDNKSRTPRKQSVPYPFKYGYIERKSVAVLSQNRSIYSYDLLWDRILYWRWYDNKDMQFDPGFISLDSLVMFYAHRSAGIDRVKAKDFLLNPCTEQEFNKAKYEFLKFFRSCLDCVDIIESLKFFGDLNQFKYPDLPSNNPEENYRHFEAITYSSFQKFFRTMIAPGQ